MLKARIQPEGLDPLMENHKAVGFLKKTGPDPIENHKTTHPAFNVGQSFKWRFAGGPLMAKFLLHTGFS